MKEGSHDLKHVKVYDKDDKVVVGLWREMTMREVYDMGFHVHPEEIAQLKREQW